MPDCNTIYKEHKRSVKYLDIAELLEKIENFGLCEGLPKQDMDIISVAVDPTGYPDPNPATVIRHTILKAIQALYRPVSCDILLESEHSIEICRPCVSASSVVRRAARKKAKPLEHQ